MQFHQRSYKPMDYKSLANMGTDLGTFQARQLEGLNQMISSGAGSPEVITLRRDVWETIPKQHFEEMRRLSKLTGVEPSIHAPVIDTIGFTPAGYSDEQRKGEERIIEDVIDKAHEMAPDRNVIVNIHSEAVGKGTIWRKNLPEQVKTQAAKDDLAFSLFGVAKYQSLTPDQKETLHRELQRELTYGVDRDSGQLVPLKFDIKRHPPETAEERKLGYKEVVWTPKRTLRSANTTQWMGEVEGLHQHEFRLHEVDDRLNRKETIGLKGYQDTIIVHTDNAVDNLFHKMQQFSPFERDNWQKLSVDEKRALGGEERKAAYEKIKDEQLKEYEKFKKAEQEYAMRIELARRAGNKAEEAFLIGIRNQSMKENLSNWSDFFAQTVRAFPPKRIVPFEEFAIEKASKTFAEAAVHSLEVAGGNINKAPIIAIENPPAQQFGLSRADEMVELLQKSREEAVSLFKKKGMSESAAKHAAEKLIGVTWDVGHINQLRQGLFSKEDIIKETEKIAPHVKHLHITDNFGPADSHLAPGMGNVPVKEMQDVIGKAGFKGKSVMETGGFIAQFKQTPWPYILDSMDSPIYEFDAAPTWQPSFYSYFFGSASYPIGYGNIFPPQHFSMYGAGFALPPALGAALPGESKKSEFAGTPMA